MIMLACHECSRLRLFFVASMESTAPVRCCSHPDLIQTIQQLHPDYDAARAVHAAEALAQDMKQALAKAEQQRLSRDMRHALRQAEQQLAQEQLQPQPQQTIEHYQLTQPENP